MSDQHDIGDELSQEQHEQLLLLTLDDRVKREVAVIFGRHALVNAEGKTDLLAIANMVYPTVSQAVVENPGERDKVGVTPTDLVEKFFPELPGPAKWVEYDDDAAAFHEAVYKKVKSEVFRVLKIEPEGLVQARLGANGGMVLCRMRGTGGREELAYVTRSSKCINTDNNLPAFKKARQAMDRAAALTALAIDRVPEHGKWFGRQHNDGMKLGIDAGKDTIRAALEANTGDVDVDE